MSDLDIKQSTTEKRFAYLDAQQDISIEATRTDDKDDWQFSIRNGMETVYMDTETADKAQQFIREVLSIPSH